MGRLFKCGIYFLSVRSYGGVYSRVVFIFYLYSHMGAFVQGRYLYFICTLIWGVYLKATFN